MDRPVDYKRGNRTRPVSIKVSRDGHTFKQSLCLPLIGVLQLTYGQKKICVSKLWVL